MTRRAPTPSRTIAAQMRRGAGRSGRSVALLTASAVGVATLSILLALSAMAGLDARIDRGRWTTPAAAERPVAVQTTTTRYVDGRTIRVVSLAPAGGEAGTAATNDLPHPPGMDRFPQPGEVWLSPALAAMARHAPDKLAGALGTTAATSPIAGVLGRSALTGPDDMLAVVGRTVGDPAMTGPVLRDLMRPDDHRGPVGISGFYGAAPGDDTELVQYRALALVAAVLLAIPALTLAAAGARLGAARRADRLAKLRLAGMGRRPLTTIAIGDALRPAAVGVIAGVLAHVAVTPLVARIPLVGTQWFAADLVLPVLTYMLVAAALLGLVAVSASAPLRQILADPISVADRHSTALPHWWRLVATVVVVAVFLRATDGGNIGTGVVVALLGTLFVMMNVIGPFVVAGVARLFVHRARSGARLVAARRILDDPKGIWRQVAPVALASFIAGFLALFSVQDATVWSGDARTLHVAVAMTSADLAGARLESALDEAGLDIPVHSTSSGGALDTVIAEGSDVAYLAIALPENNAQRTVIRRVAAETFPTAPQAVGTDVVERDNRFGADFRSATIVILAAALVLAAIGTGITATAAVIDRAATNRRLHMAGVPFELLDASRRIATTVPTLVATIGGASAGLVAAAPVTLGSGRVDAAGLALLVATIVAGLAVMRAGVRVSRPLLRRTAVS